MSWVPDVQLRTTTAELDHLPHPATKLVVTQYLKTSQDPPLWAWIIVAAFYDSDDNIIWSTEIFTAHLDLEYETDDESEVSTDREGVVQVEFGPGSAHSFAVEETASSTSDAPPLRPSIDPYSRPEIRYRVRDDDSYHQPDHWNPVVQGPVRGYWVADYDHSSRRWVHSWRPLH
ncbi:hypothetical protein HJFPF1_12638 [Paramyrothecium foliicola]|nr:hypothetical protein HJFPF1_12638 [Paramyrothecium foliicola]